MAFYYALVLVPAIAVGVMAVPLAATSITIGAIWTNKCRLTAPSEPSSPSGPISPSANSEATDLLNIWLIIYGVSYLLFALAYTPLKARWSVIAAEQDYDFSPKAHLLPGLRRLAAIATALFYVWCIAWIVFGGILLFGKQGKMCKNSFDRYGKRVWKSVLAFWILMLIGFVPMTAMFLEAIFTEDPL